MNKSLNYLFVIALAGIATLSLPLITNATVVVDVGGASSTETGPKVTPRPVAPTQIQQVLKQRLQNATNNYNDKIIKAEENRNYRNDMLASTTFIKRPPLMASSTRPIRPTEVVELRKEIQEARGEIRDKRMELASSSRAFASTTRAEMRDTRAEIKGERAEIRNERAEIRNERQEFIRGQKEARMEMYAVIRDRLVKEAQQALNNLKQIRERVSTRIQTAITNGKNMEEATKLLAVADNKITLAETAIATLKNFKPQVMATSTTQIDSSATGAINLDKPREVGAIAIKAVGDVRKALNDTVVAIAHGLGYKVDRDGRIITATTTVPKTPTASTTNNQ